MAHSTSPSEDSASDYEANLPGTELDISGCWPELNSNGNRANQLTKSQTTQTLGQPMQLAHLRKGLSQCYCPTSMNMGLVEGNLHACNRRLPTDSGGTRRASRI